MKKEENGKEKEEEKKRDGKDEEEEEDSCEEKKGDEEKEEEEKKGDDYYEHVIKMFKGDRYLGGDPIVQWIYQFNPWMEELVRDDIRKCYLWEKFGKPLLPTSKAKQEYINLNSSNLSPLLQLLDLRADNNKHFGTSIHRWKVLFRGLHKALRGKE